MFKFPLPKEGLIAITYRCNAHCHMCNIWKNPTTPAEEIRPSDLGSLPPLKFCNITGGEPFIREDIGEFVDVLSRKAERIVISTNGYFTDRIVKLAQKYPKIGIRVSIEGLAETNDKLRGLVAGFEHGLNTLREVRRVGLTDIGFGITLSDRNIHDLMALYKISEEMGLEFASACVHNNYYFHKFDNKVTRIEDFEREIKKLVIELLKSSSVKKWFRGYFNYGLLNYARGNPRLLKCRMGHDVFFIDPFGSVMACNGMDKSMGSIKENVFDDIWQSRRAADVRRAVDHCPRNCWMVGSVAPAMKRNIFVPGLWVLQNKLKVMAGQDIRL